ncbi:anthrone oxygenase family protein [Asanoa siamensis]|uniref:DUF1772 domain-containing protein n=1 Tax=Asanoa siamensis TaxID=926357 RepID=A0ABQ4CUP8_9ACTN|nr:anthrone oxygenase family protein [Asanoa siamensis]GIF75021.1 hypothetical protein Asi02nite_45390 [Asanoa siamensis]
MQTILHVAATLLSAAVMAPAVAHALELPGKRRLNEEQYRQVQRIYYPGFTIAGALEIPAVVVATVSVLVTDTGATPLRLRLLAVIALALVVAVYWLRVHPTNRIWMSRDGLDGAAERFFGTRRRSPDEPERWKNLRDRWEFGHLLRAVLATSALTAQVGALAWVVP